MDPVTHMALGACVAASADRQPGPAREVRPLVFGALVGLLPDIDIVARLFGEWAMHTHHRGITHSFFALPFMAALAGLIGWRWDGRRPSFLRWTMLAFWVLVSHVLLDAFTSYGTVLFAPFSWSRISLDGIAIVDPFYTVPLVAAAVAAYRLRSSGEGFLSPRRVAAVAVILTTIYILAGWADSARVAAKARADFAGEGFSVSEVRALPVIAFPVVRRAVARDGAGNLAVSNYSILTGARTPTSIIDAPSGPKIEQTLASDRGRTFIWFADGFVSASVDSEAGKVLLTDARYGLISRPEWSPFRAVFKLSPDGSVLSADLVSGGHRDGFDFRAEFAATWRLAFGRTR